MLVESENLREEKLFELKRVLAKQGYPIKIIENGISKAKSFNQEELRKPKEKCTNDILAFINTHNTNNPKVLQYVRQSMDILQKNSETRNIFNDIKMINCTRQPFNLERILCRPALKENNTVNGAFKCWEKLQKLHSPKSNQRTHLQINREKVYS